MASPDVSRTVVVSGIPHVLSTDWMVQKLKIYFRSAKSEGGDVERIEYPTHAEGVALVTFVKSTDADRVVMKDEQIFTNLERNYHLTVYKFTPDVFFYVSKATLDLSSLGYDKESLVRRLRSRHRSVRFLHGPGERKATVEGPFRALQILRDDLVTEVSQSANRGGSGTLGGAADPNGGHRPERTPSSKRSAQSLSDYTDDAMWGNLVNFSKVSLESPHTRSKAGKEETSFSPLNESRLSAKRQRPHRNVEEERMDHSGLASTSSSVAGKSPTCTWGAVGSSERNEGRTAEQVEAGTRDVSGSRSMTSGMGKSSSEHVSADRNRPGQSSDRHWSHSPNSTAAAAEIPGPSSKDSFESLKTNAKGVSSPTRPSESKLQGAGNATEGESIWVDSITFRYIQQFDFKVKSLCVKGGIRCKPGADLTQLILPVARPSSLPSESNRAFTELKQLVTNWESTLRVHVIDGVNISADTLHMICFGAKSNEFNDILYTVEGSRVQVVGPSTSSYLFSKRVEERIAKHEGTRL